ncbi:MAG: hypothetical protein GY730_08580 [bacterium]|nr:hypothetical protein [bacterium]
MATITSDSLAGVITLKTGICALISNKQYILTASFLQRNLAWPKTGKHNEMVVASRA